MGSSEKRGRMEIRKNDRFVVAIEDMSEDGAGIGKTDGYTWFIKDGLIGDVVEASAMKMKKNYGFARLVRVIEPAPGRVAPRCPVARACGGCQLQELDYEEQLRFKERKVFNHLKRIGGLTGLRLAEDGRRGGGEAGRGAAGEFGGQEAERESGCQVKTESGESGWTGRGAAGDAGDQAKAESGGAVRTGREIVMEPIIGMENPWRYRNKAQYPIGYGKDGELTAGFYAGRTHSMIPVPDLDCVLGCGENQKLLAIILDFMKEFKISAYREEEHKGLVRHALLRKGFASGELMVCLVINGKSLPSSDVLVSRLRAAGVTSVSLSVNREKTNVIMGTEIINLYGPGYITDRIGDIEYRISPLSFYQVNPVQTERLYGTALEFAGLTGGETVWDLYCGIGTISSFLARKAGKVYGVEIIPQAIEDARENAKRNGIHNVEFFVGKAEEVLPEQYEKNHVHADVIVVDPPRKGCDSVCLDTIVRMAPERVVYVSCDSATLARDVKYLGENGYEVKRVRAVDMFPMSGHVETVCLLSKPKSTQHIEVELDMDELDLTAAEKKATYDEIKAYVLEHTGLKVSILYIAQVKQKCGIIERENYNTSKSENSGQPQCPAEKEKAIRAALKFFGMV